MRVQSTSSAMAGVVAFFDFDKTILECDSDDWVIDKFGATEIFNQLLQTTPWNTAMDKLMTELHARGISIEEIADCLKRSPLDSNVGVAIRTAYALGCDLRIVSDANIFYIETILEHNKLLEYFSEINTNPSHIDEEGKLRISPYHDINNSPHGCSLCPPNMCKGKIIERLQASEAKKQFIYIGDGKGDYCPCLKLREGDCMMPRKNYPVWDLIYNDPQLLKAEVHEWSNAEDLKKVLLQLINKSIAANGSSTDQLLSLECKLDTISKNAAEGLLLALSVKQ